MHGFKKAIGRTTQKVKRTVRSQSAHKDPEFDMLMHSVNQQEKTLTQFDKHIVELTRSLEAQVTIARSMIHDYRMVYSKEGVTVSATSMSRDDDHELVNQLAPIVEKMDREVVRPFIDKCSTRVQQPIREYVAELSEAKTGITKTRHNKLLDYEMYRDKYNNASTNTKFTVQQVEEARMAFENARVAFDEIDQQVKHMLREVVVKRYTVFHPLVASLYGEMLAEYYESLASFGSLMRRIRSTRAPETVMPEPFRWGGDADFEPEPYPTTSSYTSTTTTTTHVLPPNPTRVTPPVPSFGGVVPPHLNKEWYFLDANNEQRGPVAVPDLKRLFRSGEVNTNTYIVTEGMGNWEILGAHELNKYVQ